MSKIKSLTVGELAGLYASPELLPQDAEISAQRQETFIVPAYQRGYRWEAEIQVQALLEDVLDFMGKSKSTDEKYCLQPLVVTPSSRDRNKWEVIDGQQRLTTLYLILKAFGEDCFNLEYETRPDTAAFLKELVSADQENHDNPDYHYISRAWKFINEWKGKNLLQVPGFKKDFPYVLQQKVNVIWYDVESDSTSKNIDIFNRLNTGKIPLTDSELVKALLLTKIKDIYSGEELNLRQAEISNEFYRIEAELRKPYKWGFLDGEKSNAHADLLLNLIIHNRNQDKLSPYLWFEKHIDKGLPSADADRNAGESLPNTSTPPAKTQALEFWKEIKKVYGIVDSWFCENGKDSEIYHYAGYLLAAKFKTVQEIFAMAQNAGKEAFKDELKAAILDQLKKDLNKEEALAEDGSLNLANLGYDSDKEIVKRVLLLLNVLTCLKIARGQSNRFPFDRYAEKAWSIEHIYPQNPDQETRSRADMRAWLDAVQKKLKTLVYVDSDNENLDLDSLKERLDKMAQLQDKDIDLQDFTRLRNDLLEIFVTGAKHGFANLALLGKDDNAALNNASFPDKRDRIINLEKAGSFIPPCTRNLFLKFYSDSDSQPYFWSQSDQDTYINAMTKLLADFMS